MNQLKKIIQEKAFNQDVLFHELMQKVERNDLASPHKGGIHFMKRWMIGLAFALVIALGIWAIQPATPSMPSVAAIVSVEINPSFELSTLEDGTVIEIDALNEDAQTIEVADLISLALDQVVETLVARSAEAGFIDLNDLEDDFVLVTTVVLDESDEDNQAALEEKLELMIQERIQISEGLQSMNVVQIKASVQERLLAQGLDVPVGLYVINGMIEVEGELVPVREFFADSERRSLVENRGSITGVGEDKLRSRIENALNQLQNAGEDVTELRTRLQNAGLEDLLRIQSEVRVNINPEAGAGENKPDEAGNQNTDTNKPDSPGSTNPDSNKPEESGPTNSNKPDDAGSSNSGTESAPNETERSGAGSANNAPEAPAGQGNDNSNGNRRP